MVVSKMRRLRFEKEEQEGRKLTYEALQQETGLAPNTLARFLKSEPLDRIDANTIDALCRFFSCGIGDLLEYLPSDERAQAA